MIRRRGSLLALLATLALTGCTNLYRHQVGNQNYTLYGNQDRPHLEKTGEYIERVIEAYRTIFRRRCSDVPAPWVIYEENELSERRIYTGEPRQEGYYLPFLGLIHLSPHEVGEDRLARETVILHEMAHHFLVCAYPASRRLYWFNEGVACALEVSFFDERGRLVTPLYHLTLHRRARNALRTLGPAAFGRRVSELVDGSWFHFHQKGGKSLHYAMSWALVYSLLVELEGDLEARVAAILDLDPEALQRAIDRLPRFLEREPDAILDELADDPGQRSWALRAWVQLPRPDGQRLLPHLLRSVERGPGPLRTEGIGLLTRALNLRIRGVGAPDLRRLRARIVRSLRHGTHDERLAVMRHLRASGRHPAFLRPLVSQLDDSSAEVRVSAAQALSRLSAHPTITRPTFWREASAPRRAREIEEWKRWLRAQGY